MRDLGNICPYHAARMTRPLQETGRPMIRPRLARLVRFALPAFTALALSSPGLAADTAATAPDPDPDRGFVTLQVENDLFANIANTDRHYTNGLQASWLSGPRRDLPGWMQTLSAPPLFSLFTDEPHVTHTSQRIGVSLAHAMFTPDDTLTSAAIPGDRPYAAWLHLTFLLQSVRSTDAGEAWQDQWKLDLGVVGPWALGRQAQNGWHSLIGADRAKGWSHQLRNEPGINLSFERAWRTRTFQTPRMLSFETDVIPYGIMALGNVQTYAGLGATFRIGPRLPDDFGPTRIYPGVGGSEWFRPTGDGCGCYVFAGLEERAIARDIFLDGNSFRDSASVDKKNFVTDAKLGAVAILGNARVSFTHVFRSKEFHGQPKPDQFGSISVSFGL